MPGSRISQKDLAMTCMADMIKYHKKSGKALSLGDFFETMVHYGVQPSAIPTRHQLQMWISSYCKANDISYGIEKYVIPLKHGGGRHSVYWFRGGR
jgi:hypothetical protein